MLFTALDKLGYELNATDESTEREVGRPVNAEGNQDGRKAVHGDQDGAVALLGRVDQQGASVACSPAAGLILFRGNYAQRRVGLPQTDSLHFVRFFEWIDN
jgi:hypothetical protein